MEEWKKISNTVYPITHEGFALIELIAVIVLVGIIASFSTFFLYTGFEGYLTTKKTTAGALDAQIALDRIALELRDISEVIVFVDDSSLTFKSEVLTGTRTLKYETNSNSIKIGVNNLEFPLMEGVVPTSFKLSRDCRDLIDDPYNFKIANIGVQFQVEGIGKKFKTGVFPRNMVQCPP